MPVSLILTNVAILLLVATHWETLKANAQVTPSRRTFLLVAAAFALISAGLQFVNR